MSFGWRNRVLHGVWLGYDPIIILERGRKCHGRGFHQWKFDWDRRPNYLVCSDCEARAIPHVCDWDRVLSLRSRILGEVEDMATVLVVGCVRSGLSLTMQMLDAGGFPCVGKYPAYEKYDLKKINWKECRGKAVKVVDTYKQFPPVGYSYKIIYLQRDPIQQALSFNKFLREIVGQPELPLQLVQDSFAQSYGLINQWFNRSKGVKGIVKFEDILSKPQIVARRLARIVGQKLDTSAMAKSVVDRSAKCYPGFLEMSLIDKVEGFNGKVV
jgi:hypothetical protein